MKKTGNYVIATMVLMLVTVFCTAGTVYSKEKQERKVNEVYYRELEREYVKELRKYLNEAGFTDSGVMLTRTVYEDGSREYHVTIHHCRFDRLTQTEKESLMQKLQENAFMEENCSFVHSLTGNA